MPSESISKVVLTTDGRVLLEQPDGSYRSIQGQTDWDHLRSMSDEQVEKGAEADPHTLPDHFWDKAQPLLPRTTGKLSVRFDADVVEWFRRQGQGYQTRMSAILRAYIEAQKQG